MALCWHCNTRVNSRSKRSKRTEERTVENSGDQAYSNRGWCTSRLCSRAALWTGESVELWPAKGGGGAADNRTGRTEEPG